MLTTHSIGITIHGASLKKHNSLKKLYFSTTIACIHLIYMLILDNYVNYLKLFFRFLTLELGK